MGKKGGTRRPNRKKYLNFRMRLWIRQHYRCLICRKQIRRRILYTEVLNLDHIIAKSRGGTRDPENLALVHLACNQLKGSDCPCDWYGEEYCNDEVHNWVYPITSMEDAIEGEE